MKGSLSLVCFLCFLYCPLSLFVWMSVKENHVITIIDHCQRQTPCRNIEAWLCASRNRSAHPAPCVDQAWGGHGQNMKNCEPELFCSVCSIIHELIIHASWKSTYWSCDKSNRYRYRISNAQLLGFRTQCSPNQRVSSRSRTFLLYSNCSFYINKAACWLFPASTFINQQVVVGLMSFIQ